MDSLPAGLIPQASWPAGLDLTRLGALQDEVEDENDSELAATSSSGQGEDEDEPATRRVLRHTAGDEEAFGSAASDPDPDPKPSAASPSLLNDDFVYAAPCSAERLHLAQASRYWRKGMRAVFVMDEAPGNLSAEAVTNARKNRESFAWYPNFKRMADDQRDHYLEGDRRAAMTPILAYAALAAPASMGPWTVEQLLPSPAAPHRPHLHNAQAPGQAGQAAAVKHTRQLEGAPASGGKASTDAAKGKEAKGKGAEAGSGGADTDPFKWMLMGDDDTVFFMRGVKALLRDYDPQLPYFLSDCLIPGSKSPPDDVWNLRCMPCHLYPQHASQRLLSTEDAPRAPGPGSGQGQAVSKDCFCRTDTLCARFQGNATRCQQEWEGPVPWGGVGAIFSIGLFKRLAALQGGEGLRAYETCINAPETSVASFPLGGDAFMSRCLWRLGFPITDPGYTPLGRYMGEILGLKEMYEVPKHLKQGAASLPNGTLERWSVAVSMHLGARKQPSYRSAALSIKYITSVYDLVAEMLWPSGKPKPAGAS
ncbi:hypothetical protein HYH03_006992 [Edaphochlamys debaryana]|uniref:Uncharacterized protein n=1 Tax=Edaphochlamys debaryana TaxID=47281 RepID=A0A835Y2I7_9CHLO|nr:hypothetical protein HYH03_006992 [Edaphochlamys debaryana]|eukprot:KAG2494746.1 hypothetical protein HYH03_006992 [Edaphochlamys debaryana]